MKYIFDQMPKPCKSKEQRMRIQMRWGSNRHIKELLFRSENKREIRKENREEQSFRHKKMKEGDKNDHKSGKQMK
jgi:hypothetical protein